jgi:hypothetical protein
LKTKLKVEMVTGAVVSLIVEAKETEAVMAILDHGMRKRHLVCIEGTHGCAWVNPRYIVTMREAPLE